MDACARADRPAEHVSKRRKHSRAFVVVMGGRSTKAAPGYVTAPLPVHPAAWRSTRARMPTALTAELFAFEGKPRWPSAVSEPLLWPLHDSSDPPAACERVGEPRATDVASAPAAYSLSLSLSAISSATSGGERSAPHGSAHGDDSATSAPRVASLKASSSVSASLRSPPDASVVAALGLPPITADAGAILTLLGEANASFPFAELALGEIIGDGSFSVVYRATLRGAAVAVKMFRTLETLDTRASYEREVALAPACANHPNVVKMLARCDRPLCIVMELVDGACLFDLVHSSTFPFTWALLERSALGVARALAHLHAQGVVHRDVKSLNVLVSDGLEVKLCDFGLGRYVAGRDAAADGSSAVAASLPITGGRGTPQYMAPEVILHKSYDASADVYSFGVMLWEMLTRRLPYDGSVIMNAVAAVAFRGYRPAIPVDTPRRVAELLSACWTQEPAARPSAAQIVHFLLREPLVSEAQRNACIPFALRSRGRVDQTCTMRVHASRLAQTFLGAVRPAAMHEALRFDGIVAETVLPAPCDLVAAAVVSGRPKPRQAGKSASSS